MRLRNQLGWFNTKTFLLFSGSNIIYQLITLVAELAILKMVSVELIGTWQYALLIQSYVVFARLGIINSFNREYPYLTSLQNYDKADSVLKTTAFHIRMSMAVQALAFVILLIYQFVKGSSPDLKWALAAMIAYTLLEAQSNFEEAKLRNVLFFKQISIIKIIQSLMILVTLFLPYYFGFHGLLWRVITLQILLLISYKMSTKGTSAKWDKTIWLELFNDGWKFWLWSYLKSFIKSLPKLFIVTFSTITVLGLFTPINWMMLSFTLLTTSLGTYLYPNLSQRFAKGNQDLPYHTLIISAISFLITIPFIIIGFLTLPWFIKEFLPKYSEAILPMKIAIIASSFEIFAISSTVWVAMKDWTRMFIFLFFSAFLRLLSLFWLYFNQDELLLNLSYTLLFVSLGICLTVTIMIVLQNMNFSSKTKSITH